MVGEIESAPAAIDAVREFEPDAGRDRRRSASSSLTPAATALVHEIEHDAGRDRRGPRDRALRRL
jgi:hypothetical protein